MQPVAGTYSIVAVDTATGEVGVAVQSKYFCVGAVVPWVKAGVGAVATQAAGIAGYGPQILSLLEAGRSPDQAIAEALASDEGRETRQLGVVDASGRRTAFTGRECNEWAGHVEGDGYAAQGNTLAGDAVVAEMARAYEATAGPLADRLMASLEAAEAAGGDRRGRQSSALVVERSGAADTTHERIDRIVDLRVDDHPEPIAELRRLLELHTRWRVVVDTYALYERGDYEQAIRELRAALPRFADDATLLYNLACYESLAGLREAAIASLQRAVVLDSSLREMARTDSDFDAIRDVDAFQRIIA